MWFTVECEEVDEEASVLVDDEEVYAIYDSGNNTFAFKLEYSSWANKDCLYVKVRKNHNGYATPVVSKPYIVNIEKHNWNDYNLEYTWLDNRFISCGLGKLNENDLLVTNSNEDFLYYFGKGQRVFEVDFQFTSDGVLVGKNNFDKEIPVSYEVLQNNTMDFTIVSFEEICQLLLNYKDMYIVTNIKDTNSIAVDRIFQYMVSCAKKYDESILDRIIIQVYNEEMYSQIMEIYPFKSVIYNLSQKTIDDKKVLQFIKSTGIKVVTINENQISDGLIKKLYDLDCYVYVDSVDEIDLVKKYLSKGVYGYYTNSLCEVDSREYLYDIIWDEMDNQSITYNREQFISYLNSLNSERYIVCFAVVDDASMMMTDELHTIFDKWGFSSNILSDFRYSFIGISNNGKAIVEKYDNEALSYSGKIDEIYVEMQSAGFAFGNYSSICIDGTEYSTNVSGLNIVVYDKYLGKVISKVGFNLFSDYTRTDG